MSWQRERERNALVVIICKLGGFCWISGTPSSLLKEPDPVLHQLSKRTTGFRPTPVDGLKVAFLRVSWSDWFEPAQHHLRAGVVTWSGGSGSSLFIGRSCCPGHHRICHQGPIKTHSLLNMNVGFF